MLDFVLSIYCIWKADFPFVDLKEKCFQIKLLLFITFKQK